ncbi:MAG: hypothetical protein LBH26_01540 [Treponema sp.]|jgi:hypothetical protein|nr:hypothetical protein [Treponema sp.]
MSFLNKYDPQTIESAQEAAGEFNQFPVGDNPARIIGVVEKTSKNGNDMLEITFGNEQGMQIRDYIVDGEYAASKLKNLQTSFKIPYGEQNIKNWIGKPGIIVVKEGEEYNGRTYNRVSHYRSPKTSLGAQPGPGVASLAAPARTQTPAPAAAPAPAPKKAIPF